MRGQDAVNWFARHMMQKLAENEHKPHWSKQSHAYFLHRIDEEMKEMRAALRDFFPIKPYTPLGEPFSLTHARALIRECADVANFAMMIADRTARLAAKNPPVGMTSDQVLASLWHKGGE